LRAALPERLANSMNARMTVIAVAAVCLAGSACGREEPKSDVGNDQVQGHYSRQTGKLERITYDSNKNGKIDTWSYMDGTRVLRVEIDKDEDGRIDRWEYYKDEQKLEKVGYSRANSGKPDAFAFQGPDGKVARVELMAPDDRVRRTERYEGGVLVSAEEDTNSDGRTDKWETYEDSALASVAFDTTGRGKPDRRLVYGQGGQATVEVDPDGDGKFVRAAAAPAARAR
jgi:hypothetical protein